MYSTIKTYLAAIRFLQVSQDLPEPRASPMPKLSIVERGIRSVSQLHTERSRLPISPDILRQLKALWSAKASEYDTIMLWAACCTAFFGFFRLGEIMSPTVTGANSTHGGVTVGDVAVDNQQNPTVISIHLRKSKTDQLGRGVDIYLGKTGEDLCPVAALLAYLAVRGGEPGPLFRLRDGRFLTKAIFTARVRASLEALGYDSSSYAGHSFRIGAATAAAERGIEDSIIKALGRWESAAYQIYVRSSRQMLQAMSKRLVATIPDPPM